ncbi:hypothetical protein BAE44_0015563 [Dichanthelium oligosanthes]|uniref:Uncharacterized protein n=1 Tax=Dichanthelium oligosanthes TaxID=888268 RepID=A0A1E5VE43_9POAL|nr:hypothetical protein BAE44_0015563 [Dichanthelium oligosanthes]
MDSPSVPLGEIPPTAVDAEDDTIPYAVPIRMSMDPNIGGPEPFDALPLRMIPFGGKEPITFSQQELDRLRKQEVDHPQKQEVPIPMRLKSHDLYVEGDWTAFVQRRTTGHKDLVSAFCQ